MITLSKPNISDNELKYVKECLDTGWISSAATYADKFEDLIQRYAVECMNGTAGLQFSLNLTGVKS